MGRHGAEGPAEPPRNPAGDTTGPRPTGGALYAARTAEPDTPARTSRSGIIGARPAAGTAPQPANAMPPPASTGAQAPPAVPAPQSQSVADSTVPRAYVAAAA